MLKFAIVFLVMASSSLVGAQTLQTLFSFNTNYANGGYPSAALTLGNDGNFYGVTGAFYNNTNKLFYATVFKVTTNGTLTTFATINDAYGASPAGALTLGSDGNFYGTTVGGGNNNLGTVFQVTTNGTLTTLVAFANTNGANPQAALTLGNDGNFYGTTSGGFGSDKGTVFKVTTDGTLTTLVFFANTNGASPRAAMTLGNDGNFYGTTYWGGITNSTYPYGMGTVFQVTPNGTLTTLVSFNGTNGAYPQAALTLGNDGNFYGTTGVGGGPVFQVTTNGTLTTLFSSVSVGVNPSAALTLGNDGNFYGTTSSGGSNGKGTIFQVTTNGAYSALFSFNTPYSADQYALTLGNDGNFYGVTQLGGSGAGSVFRMLLNPPIITYQPQSQTNNAGATVVFVVIATNLNPMNYQWLKNGTNLANGDKIAGATTNTLTITSISDSDAASYSVIVSNSIGSVTSSNATLTVIDPPVITAQPTNLLVLPGTNVAFGVSLTGLAPFFRYQWRFNGTNLLNATNAIYTILSVVTNKAGNYSVMVTNAAGSVTSSNAALTVVLSPTSRTNYASSTSTFTATAFSPESLNYQWQKNGTNLMDGGNLSGTTNSTLTIANVSDADAAIYNLIVSDATGGVTTSNAVLTVNDFLFIALQPQSQTVLVGSNVTFNVTTYGAPPFVFQWYFKGTPVGSPTTGTNVSSYTLTNVGTNQAGNYSVQMVNSYGSLTSSNATLTVVSPPIINTQPSNRTNSAGATATFLVVVSSVSQLSYQWQKNGTNLVNGGKFSGATTNTLTITSVSSNEAAIYSVTITNLAGSVTSSNATLTVIYPPVITTQPLGQRLVLGNGVSFNVAVSGTAPFNYQWRFNGGNLLDATNANYAIQAIVATNTGNYSVVVTNLAGSVTSSNALLTVLVPPTLALQLWAGYPLLNLNGMLSNNFVVQYNTDLTGTNWVTLLSLSNLLTSPYLFLDPAGVVPPARFYRAVMQ